MVRGVAVVGALALWAAACTPVIGLDTGGARDIVRDGVDGLLIETADPATAQSGGRREPGA